MIKRYDHVSINSIFHVCDDMQEMENGEYVKFEDYLAMKNQGNEVVKMLHDYAVQHTNFALSEDSESMIKLGSLLTKAGLFMAGEKQRETKRGDVNLVITDDTHNDDDFEKLNTDKVLISENQKLKCRHKNTLPNLNYHQCSNCGEIKTNKSKYWNDAKDKWFKTLFEAMFYREYGYIPTGIDYEY